MTFAELSDNQRRVFRWWNDRDLDALICDGSVRSGKTAAMSCSFILWAMKYFSGASFGICGNTVQAVERNIIGPLMQMTDITYYFRLKYTSAGKHMLTISGGGRENYFYIFGGKDEASYKLIQGITLAGVFFDEVALMPESFVNQAIARTLSVDGAKLWFSCNPDSPNHWFYTEWIKKADEKKALRLHFTMQDNPTMTPAKIARTESMFSGVFYDRYVLGKWVVTEGLVYTMFDRARHVGLPEKLPRGDWYISIDYGTVNPTSMGLWLKAYNGQSYRVRESYYDARKEGVSRTDEEHYEGLCRLIGDKKVEMIVCDPSAQSFIQCIQRHGRYSVVPAKNDVVWGIRLVSDCIRLGRIKFSEKCTDTIREFSLYRWDEKAGKDCPIKENDHAMDDIRYFVTAFVSQSERDFFVMSLDRDTENL